MIVGQKKKLNGKLRGNEGKIQKRSAKEENREIISRQFYLKIYTNL